MSGQLSGSYQAGCEGVKIKRLFFTAVLFFSAALVHADYTPSLQSTRTCAAEQNILVATGSIKLVRIVVSSPTLNMQSSLTIHDSTTSSSGGYNPNTSTITSLSTNSNELRPFQIDYDHNMSSGMVLNKQGAACIECSWRFVYPENELEGLTGRLPPLDSYRP